MTLLARKRLLLRTEESTRTKNTLRRVPECFSCAERASSGFSQSKIPSLGTGGGGGRRGPGEWGLPSGFLSHTREEEGRGVQPQRDGVRRPRREGHGLAGTAGREAVTRRRTDGRTAEAQGEGSPRVGGTDSQGEDRPQTGRGRVEPGVSVTGARTGGAERPGGPSTPCLSAGARRRFTRLGRALPQGRGRVSGREGGKAGRGAGSWPLCSPRPWGRRRGLTPAQSRPRSVRGGSWAAPAVGERLGRGLPSQAPGSLSSRPPHAGTAWQRVPREGLCADPRCAPGLPAPLLMPGGQRPRGRGHPARRGDPRAHAGRGSLLWQTS